MTRTTSTEPSGSFSSSVQIVMNVHFRPACPDDAEQIAQFNLLLARETEGRQLDPSTLLCGVRHGLQRSPEVRYFVAETEKHRLAGQLMFTREWSDWRDGWMLWLQSVYIDRSCRNRGIFRELLTFALHTISVDHSSVGVRLYVDQNNTPAQAVYRRLGFRSSEYDLLELKPEQFPTSPSGQQPDDQSAG